MFRRLSDIAIFLLLATILGGCVTEERITPTSETSRVLLVYIGTDNNLSGYEQEKLDGIRAGWSGKANDRIIVYIDDRSGNARLIEVSNLAAGEQPRELETYGVEDSASAETFGRVITDVLSNYKADCYNLLVFSHASGWLPEGALANPYTRTGHYHDTESAGNESRTRTPQGAESRSVIIDGASEMDLQDFAKAIPDGVFRSIVFEMCFMAGIEVAYELRNKAEYIFASSAEILHPGFAPTYATGTTHLFDANLQRFGQKVFDHVLTYADTDPKRSATYSVIRTAGLEQLASFIRQECHFGVEVDVADVQHFDRYNYRLFFDFKDYYGRLLPNDTKRAELARLIDDCVTWKEHTPEFMTQQSGYNGFVIENHSGLTTYIPQEQFEGLNEAYGNLTWTRAIR